MTAGPEDATTNHNTEGILTTASHPPTQHQLGGGGGFVGFALHQPSVKPKRPRRKFNNTNDDFLLGAGRHTLVAGGHSNSSSNNSDRPNAPLVIPAVENHAKWQRAIATTTTTRPTTHTIQEEEEHVEKQVAADGADPIHSTATSTTTTPNTLPEDPATAAAILALQTEAGTTTTTTHPATGSSSTRRIKTEDRIMKNSTSSIIRLAAVQSHHSNGAADIVVPKAIQSSTTTTTINGAEASIVKKEDPDSSTTIYYKQELETLPTELDERDTAYDRTPIAEFGAALLRGMGWTDNETNTANKNNKDDESAPAFPRPSRLGLGAIPDPVSTSSKSNNNKPRRPEQYQRDQRLQQQNNAYRQERERQVAADPQKTLQTGSIVWVKVPNSQYRGDTSNATDDGASTATRARIVKLVGVPGLNMIQVQLEHSSSSTMKKDNSTKPVIAVVKRHAIYNLVPRPELEHCPFSEAPLLPPPLPISSSSSAPDETFSQLGLERRSHKKRDRHEGEMESSAASRQAVPQDNNRSSNLSLMSLKQPKQEQYSIQWVIPNIRVRVVTKRLGVQYYEQKGVVVDVTIAGATLQMNKSSSRSSHHNAAAALGHQVLDHVPERYLETALPKVGGNVIVLTAFVPSQQRQSTAATATSLKYAKGRLLERNSRHGVVQLLDDLSVVNVPLDDLAEWCGPLDDGDANDDG